MACKQPSPCPSVEAALATTRPYLKLTGTTIGKDAVRIADLKLTILADTGAMLTRDTPGPLLRVDGSSQLEVFDLEITGASGPEGIGIWMSAGNKASVSLQRVTISNNAIAGLRIEQGSTAKVAHSTISGNDGDGVSAQRSTIAVTQSSIQSNSGLGILSDDSRVNIHRSTIDTNTGGGLKIHAPIELNIANNFIVRNGSKTAAVGGIDIQVGSATTQALQFNTIVDNQKRMELWSAGGVICQGRIVASNNLIFRNTGGDTSNPQTAGDCSYGNSLLTTPPVPGFLSATDYHLTAATPMATIRDSFSCTGQADIDGDARPQGGSCDLGADEYKTP